MSTDSYVNARAVTLTTVSSPTATQHKFWAAAPGVITSAPGGGHTLYGDDVDDTFYIYSATDQVVVAPPPRGIDTVVDGAWNAAYVLSDGVNNLIVAGNNQVVTGNAMDNLIIAQTGTTTMLGGGGNDVFVCGSAPCTIIDPIGSGSDAVYGFVSGRDHVSLPGGTAFTDFASVQAAMTQSGSDVMLDLGGGQSMVFRDTQVASFVAQDFYLPLNLSGFTASFDDEFDGFSQSSSGTGSVWTATLGHGVRTLAGNHEAEYYSDSSVGISPFALADGVLTITAAPTDPSSNPLGLTYTSGAINTQHSFAQLYGYFELRAQLPAGAGFWPAFWLLPASGAWPPELDAMEQLGSAPDTDVVSVHTVGPTGAATVSASAAVKVGDTTDGFHTYAVYWGPDVIRWYFDGQEIATAATPADMNTPMYLTVNLAVGGVGSWPGPAVAGSSAHMLVDYVRAYAVPPVSTSSTADSVSSPAGAAFAIAATSAVHDEGNKGNTPFTFTVTRSGNIDGAHTIAWSVIGADSGASATAADFVGGVVPHGTLTFAPGVLSQTITANIQGDTTAEADEQFRVVLSAPSNGSITTGTATGVVVNDDTNLAASIAIGSHAEGNSGATPFTFTITRSGLLTGVSTVQWYVTGPPAGSGLASVGAADFVGGAVPAGGTISFAAGETTQTVTVNVQGDTYLEPDEYFQLGLRSAVGATITTATALAKVVNDDTAFAIAATSAAHNEGNAGATTPFTFTVTRSGNIAGTHTIAWGLTGAASGASANAADFVGGTVPTGVLTFAPGVSTQTITVNVRGDLTIEPDEGFQVVLSNASAGANITTQTASGTIVNDDTGFAVSIAVGSHAEGNSGATPFVFTVTRSGLVTGANTVEWYATGPAAGSGLASVGANDFVGATVPAGGTLSFAAGRTTQTVTVNIQGDTLLEPDEYFQLGLRNPSGGGIITGATALAKVVNDDTAFSIAATDAVKYEGNSGTTPFVFTVTRSGNIAGTHSIGWLVSGAQPNSVGLADFVSGSPLSGGLTFAPGESSKTITIAVQGDTLVEPDEHFTVLLRNASAGAAITVNNAGGTILNDDSAPSPDSTAAPLATADLTGDGVADALRLGGSGDLYLLDGATGAQSAISQSAYGLHFLAAADLNADGRADLLMQSANGGLYDWTMHGATVAQTELIATLSATQSVAGVASGEILLHDSAAGTADPWTLIHMQNGAIFSTAASTTQPNM